MNRDLLLAERKRIETSLERVRLHLQKHPGGADNPFRATEKALADDLRELEQQLGD